jgi:uncharacterized protein (DUF779 family)
MTIVRVTGQAAAVIARARQERRGPLSFSIDGGCCEGTAPHLIEHYFVAAGVEPVAEVEGVPVYLPPGMREIYRQADVTIDVVDDEGSDAMSVETQWGLRFVLRESAQLACPPPSSAVEDD